MGPKIFPKDRSLWYVAQLQLLPFSDGSGRRRKSCELRPSKSFKEFGLLETGLLGTQYYYGSNALVCTPLTNLLHAT